MNNRKTAKAEILRQLLELVSTKIETSRAAIASAKASRDSDTKSSAGDKYETGRAMMQQEIANNEVQLNKALNQQEELSRIDLNKKYSKVTYGSMVITNHENYFISIALGKLTIADELYYTISLAAPIGMLLKDKSAGDKITFQGREFVVLEIV